MRTTIAKYGDRWDLVAYDIYGDATLVPQLLKANSTHIDVSNSIITEGTTINIPDIYVETLKIAQTQAPWRR